MVCRPTSPLAIELCKFFSGTSFWSGENTISFVTASRKTSSPQIPQILGNESNKFTLKVSSKQHFDKVLL